MKKIILLLLALIILGGEVIYVRFLSKRADRVATLRRQLKDGNAFTRGSAAHQLGTLGYREDAIIEFVKLLENKTSSIRWRALNGLGELSAKEAMPLIMKHLTDKDADVRWHVVKMLGSLGIKEAAPEIEKLLTDENRLVRDHAKYALKKLRNSDYK